MHRPVSTLPAALFAAVVAFLAAPPDDAGMSASRHEIGAALADGPAAFASAPAIWPHAAEPLAHEVALFRHGFTVAAPVRGARVEVFADTRYELWLDGVWVGRGPGRFTRYTHEFDAYPLQTLAPGTHHIAVLVQWSPNLRRSESERPALQLRVTEGAHVFVRTDPEWRAIRATAWSADAVPVHAWGLIGATELLDLNRLPAGWMQPGFNDASWGGAVQVTASTAHYRPRSIPLLAEFPIRGAVAKRGWLARDQRLVELQPGSDHAQSIAVSTGPSDVIVVETLSPVNAPQIDLELPPNATGVWTTPGDWHPDVRRAVITLTTGASVLAFHNIPAPGWPVLVSGSGPATAGVGKPVLIPIAAPSPPISVHTGRRLLLARPRDDANAVDVEAGSDATNMSFAGAPSFVVLDLGRVVHGRIEAQVQGERGAIVDIGWTERVWRDGYPLPYLGSLYPEWSQADSWVLDGTKHHIRTIDSRAGRYVLIAVWTDAPLRLVGVRVLEERYPVPAGPVFRSGNARLDAIWRVGRDTAMLNMLDAYADPWRERGQWWGDATVVDRVNEAVFGVDALLRRGLLFAAEARTRSSGLTSGPSTTTHTGLTGNLRDYGMLWVQNLRRYVDRTNDASILAECYPAMQGFMADLAVLEHPATGLIEIPRLDWAESALIDWPAFYNPEGSAVHGQSAAVNAMYYKTLLDAAAIAALAGDDAFATAWAARAWHVRAGINDWLYAPDQRRYYSSIVDGRLVPPTLYAQAWPLAYDVVPAERVTDTVDALLELISRDPERPNVEPYGMFWVLEALGRTGRVDAGIDLIELYYGRLLDRGATTWWETWDADRDLRKSLSHGWGSAPTWFLSTYAKHLQRAR
jgi:alpha-L-rhamnosidase